MTAVTVGTALPPLEVRPTSISLMRFSAVTWNPHRIHYDESYAATEGYPGVLVHGHLHGAWLLACVRSWASGLGRVEEFSWQNRHYAVPGDLLTITGEVVDVDDDLVVVDLAETNAEGRLCAPGRAVVRLNFPQEGA
ncbi:MaoC/PaaZ C-terminal domain-containing protein [Nocardioides caldifontis]|uniref:MaoC/PaaZ C-terminal domain-containing protein n=1 Tax=Nocardioides caldifontis TaxID=2588938 RepID=UPI0011DF83C3|nr:MaoC/PaaZ C-terminal domain-containing protein [Nocardioides caldifontis]